jgi:hypothetical protein
MDRQHALVENSGDEDALLGLPIEDDVTAVFEPAELSWRSGVWTPKLGRLG